MERQVNIDKFFELELVFLVHADLEDLLVKFNIGLLVDCVNIENFRNIRGWR